MQLHDGLDESQAGKGGKGPNAVNGGNGKGLRVQEVDAALEALVATQEHIRAHKDVETQKVRTATYLYRTVVALDTLAYHVRLSRSKGSDSVLFGLRRRFENTALQCNLEALVSNRWC